MSFLFHTFIIIAAMVAIWYLFTWGKNVWKRKRDRDILRATQDLQLDPDGSYFYDDDGEKFSERDDSRLSMSGGGIEMMRKGGGKEDDEVSLATATTTASELIKGKKDYSLVNIEFA